MNQEAVFALRFIMKDFAKMRKGVEQMNKNLDKMQKNANKASGGIEKINTSMGKTIRHISKLALAYFALSKLISNTFKKATEQVQLDLMAQSAGVAAEKVAKLGKALRLYGGDAKSAGSAYSSLTDIIGGAQHGYGVSQDVARVNAMFGIGFNYGNISHDELMTNIAKKMKELRDKGDQWGINQIASAYGIDASLANFLADKGEKWSSVANRQKYEEVSKSETQKLIESQDNLNTQLANIVSKMIPILEKLVNGISIVVDYLEDKYGDFVRKRKEQRERDELVNEHIDEFAGFQQGKTKKNWFTGEYSTDYEFLPKGTKLERAQYVMDKLRESGWDTKVMTEYLKVGQELAKRYGEDFGYDIGLNPVNNNGLDVIVNVGGVVVQDNTGTVKGKLSTFENGMKKAIGNSMLEVQPQIKRN